MVSDSHTCSSGDFSHAKFILVAFLGLVVGGGNLGQSDELLLPSELLSPVGPGCAGVVSVVSSS